MHFCWNHRKDLLAIATRRSACGHQAGALFFKSSIRVSLVNTVKSVYALTLNITNPLSLDASYTFGARTRMSQYGHGQVQKSTISSGTLMGASREAEGKRAIGKVCVPARYGALQVLWRRPAEERRDIEQCRKIWECNE